MSVEEAVKQIIENNYVVIFGTSTCKNTKYAFDLIGDYDAETLIVNLDQEPNGNEIQKYLNKVTRQYTMPKIFMCENYVGGLKVADSKHVYETGVTFDLV
ncbi:uncharacterized protein BYT42DRAFT_614870 [Radiomyces spectabilis]|uniref:uncharacterized protein n=1 Tax=Radiomyces spectabilis TaxID=64574 RepID=UPI00221F3B54|nr:uncharacterized protein BYT42DRAFT_614870 [Radiomyces spectabilis]KAI8376083.1 hypothetical protein BYT42DRAFT_614870 [Radiomyces spectabilis]